MENNMTTGRQTSKSVPAAGEMRALPTLRGNTEAAEAVAMTKEAQRSMTPLDDHVSSRR